MTSSGWVSVYDEAALAPAAAGNPVSTIIHWGGGGTGATIPTGYLECNGAAVNRTTYAALFAIISTKYGAGDGSTTFNLPTGDQCVPLGIASTVNTRATTVVSAVQSANHVHTLASHTIGNQSADHTHTASAMTLNTQSANHTHNFSDFYNTGTEHTGKVTLGNNANHTHTLSSMTLNVQSANHAHTITAMTLNTQSADHTHSVPVIAATYLIKY